MEPTPGQLDQFMSDGFVILRGMIPPDELSDLQRSADVIYEKSPKQRVWLTETVDHETANALEFCVDDRVFHFSRNLMRASDAAGSGMWMFGAADTGWHRDIQPAIQAPLDGLQEDIRHNRPPYVQWHIALEHDPFLHVIPGSHLRRNNEAERSIERRDGAVPLRGMTCPDLEAGDGVVYINAILHCAKPSGEKKRRTLHFGYEGYGIQAAPHFIAAESLGVDFVKYLSPWAANRFRNFDRLRVNQIDEIASLFRAMVDRDDRQFRERLGHLHPGRRGRVTSLAVLSRTANRMRDFRGRNSNENRYASGSRIEDLASRFTAEEICQLWSRFAVLDQKLQSDQVQREPLFQGEPTTYYLYEMPENFEVEDFVASWNSS